MTRRATMTQAANPLVTAYLRRRKETWERAEIATALTPGLFYICDLRKEWRGKWAVTFWRPDDAGYAFPLTWSGKYDADRVKAGGEYYSARKGKTLIRFPVPCDVAEALAVAPPPGKIAGDAGPVVMNNGKNRIALRKAGREVLAVIEDASP